MDLANTALVNNAASAPMGSVQSNVQIRVLKQALHLQTQGVLDLLQSLPPDPPLASSGTLGTRLNTYA